MIAFNKYYNHFNLFSSILVIVSLILLTFKGLNFGIDFKGGTLIEIRSESSDVNITDLRSSISNLNIGDVSIKNFGTKRDFIIKLELSNEKNSENVNLVKNKISSYFNDKDIAITPDFNNSALTLGPTFSTLLKLKLLP